MTTYILHLTFAWNEPTNTAGYRPLTSELYKEGQNTPVSTDGSHTFNKDDSVKIHIFQGSQQKPLDPAATDQAPGELDIEFSYQDPSKDSPKWDKSPMEDAPSKSTISYATFTKITAGIPAYWVPGSTDTAFDFATNMKTGHSADPAKPDTWPDWNFKMTLKVSAQVNNETKSQTFVWDPELIVDPHTGN